MCAGAYFSDAESAGLGDGIGAFVMTLRRILVSIGPSNVSARDTWLRRDMAGYDFVMPHKELRRFALVVRSDDSGTNAALAYSGCRNRIRSDEFDAAFGRSRGDMVQNVRFHATCDEPLRDAVRAYLMRRLNVVWLKARGGKTVATQVFWPATDQARDARLVWQERHRFFPQLGTDRITGVAAFDEASPTSVSRPPETM
jgi:hypothetical protein